MHMISEAASPILTTGETMKTIKVAAPRSILRCASLPGSKAAMEQEEERLEEMAEEEDRLEGTRTP